ncbi:acyl-CoA dehydrogenase family protein [Sphingomonas immobilis]|uniref:Acyl-CoA dehydrogenase family protein n=1 Tax=Sphingomonas immobilis TaxID=3063997 RepID=A0ABT8ZYA6_9SPHN|nr:acyl-CoA dehydrogenase family protein [Sphingomonas sp. CA1-15]MDO7842104.1 acyl-CoA dehydrogenase family protein [Sphingomonas sp. CA1-15]
MQEAGGSDSPTEERTAMQFDFSDDQKELRDGVRRLLDQRCPISVVRAVADGEAGHSAELWREIGESGFLAAAVPEQYGGVGAGYLELCLVAQELGRSLAPLPTVSSVYQASEALLIAGSDAQKAAWLPRLASGAAIGTVALAERPGETTPGAIAATVRGGKLSGVKIPVADGIAADLAIVLAKDEAGGQSLFLADLGAAGVTREGVKTIDPTRKHARLSFADTPVEPLGAAGQGWALLDRVRDRAAVLTAFEQIGGAEAALFMARDYALQRFAFGRQIGSFQAIKHMLADMYVALELARSNCYYGAWALSVDSDTLPAAAASARVAATQAYQLCSANTIQVHGGMGFTWEFDCHLHYRRSNYLALALGGASLWESRLIAAIRPRAA